MNEEARRRKAKELRFKKPICSTLNLSQIQEDLCEMQSTCEDVRWFMDDDRNLVDAMDGDEDEAFEFKVAFSDLAAELEQFQGDLEDAFVPECFDDLFPATGAGAYDGLMGYDSYESDYFGLEPYQYEWAQQESEKRICRMTKKELLEATGACLKVVVQYLAVKYRYECLESSLKILQGRNAELLKLFTAIGEQYEKAEEFFKWEYHEEVRKLDRMIDMVPQEYWIQ